jgi:Rhodanese-like domain.
MVREDLLMTLRATLLIVTLGLTAGVSAQAETPGTIENPAIDMEGHLRIAAEAAQHRQSRRLSEDVFLSMTREEGTVVLDARSRDKYDELHVAGAVNLPFPDITVASLNQLLPDKNTRVLIYCNNNFVNAEKAFPSKISRSSLNVSTYITLYDYGYRNVYELGPLLDAKTTRIPFDGTSASSVRNRPQPMPAAGL